MANLQFDGDVIVVTGAGSGLGRAHAMELARRGARVVVNDLGVDTTGKGTPSSAAGGAVVEAIRAAGGEAVGNPDTVATPEGGEAIVRTALDTWGRIDALVHNAGFTQDNHFQDMTVDQYRAVVDVHLLGGFYVAQPAYRFMKDNGGGRIVITGSMAGLLGAPLMANYSSGKLGAVGLAKAIAIEGEQYNIKSNVLSPGAVTRRGDDPNAFRFTQRSEKLDLQEQPARELMTPERVAPMVAVLCHSSCPVTGQVLMSRGGWFARAWVSGSSGWAAGPGEVRAEDILDHWDEVAGTHAGGDELPLDGIAWSHRFTSEYLDQLMGKTSA
jgi:NAD(P)-dependent dehydrogenase (short-subunit alcohol dehydrogenase family)